MNLWPKFCLVISALIPAICFAHGDVEEPLFVATDGVNTGRCKDPENPCRSLGFALAQSGKGSQIRVAEGRYNIDSAENLFLLATGTVDVSGGYRANAGFAPPVAGTTTLTGVPAEYRELLQVRGIQIIADSKGNDKSLLQNAQKMLAQNAGLQKSMAFTPCAGGSANGLPCDSVDLLSHVAFADVSGQPSATADVWGFVDLNTRREYAIVGYNNGTAVFDVSDPTMPLEVGFIPGQDTVWRDIKVYQFFDSSLDRWQAYAYVATDGASDGLFIIDLTELPHSISMSPYQSDFITAHNVYASNADFATGISLTGQTPELIIAGSNLGGTSTRGRYRVYSLESPDTPTFVGESTDGRYMHDAASMIVADARKDTQCVNAGAVCNILFDFNESEIEVWDITDPLNGVRLSSTTYGNAEYVHSGWWSEDRRYLFAHDELDEQRAGLSTTLRIFSIEDLRNPVLVGTWSGPTNAIDHNGFARGNRYYMSNYARGLTVLDISVPEAPTEAGHLDTYPMSDSSNFVGAWGVYPFFHSGSIAISDINSGLYIAADNSRDVPQGRLAFGQHSYAVEEGRQATVDVVRLGGSTGAVSVTYQMLNATADGNDTNISSGTLSWGSGDVAPKSIVLTASDDGATEGLEFALLQLSAPTNGATLDDANTASLYMNDTGSSTSFDFDLTEIEVAERGFSTAVVTVRRRGTAVGAASTSVTMIGGDAEPGSDFSGSTSQTVNWADGDGEPKALVFNIVDDGVSEDEEFFELELGNGETARIVITDGRGTNSAPIANAGSTQTVNEATTITLDGGASSDPDGDNITFAWQQTLGPTVTLADSSARITTFIAPDVTSDMLLQFRLTVSDSSGQTDTTNVSITVRDTTNSSSGGGATNYLLLALLLGAASWRINRTDAA